MLDSKQKLLREINKRQLASYMNNSKWQCLLPNLKLVDAEINCKWIFDKDPSGWTRSYSIPAPQYFEATLIGPIRFREIEWLEIRTPNNDSLCNLLSEGRVHYSQIGSIYKVWGYANSCIESLV